MNRITEEEDDSNNNEDNNNQNKSLDQVSTASSKSSADNDNDDTKENPSDEENRNTSQVVDETNDADVPISKDPTVSRARRHCFPIRFYGSHLLLDKEEQDRSDPNTDDDQNRTRRQRRFRKFFQWGIPIVLILVILGVVIGNLTHSKPSVRGASSSSASTSLDQTSPTSAPIPVVPSTPVPTTPVPTALPSSIPSLAPTISMAPTRTVAPSNVPSDIPTPFPSYEPSEAPPSASPTISPMPSAAPSISAAPTSRFRPIDPSTKFTLRMHWEEEYMWQDDPNEMFWCWECTECALNYDVLDAGVGCSDSNSDDPSCEREDQIWLQRCNGHGSSTGNAEFQLWQHDTYDIIRVADTDLCLTRINKEPDYIYRYLYIDVCSALNLQQRWNKIPDLFGKPFDLRPDVIAFEDNVDRCVTQLHHPKAGEVLHMRECTDAYGYNTALYDALPVDGGDNDEDNNDDDNNNDDN
jgi:hypothetical protein